MDIQNLSIEFSKACLNHGFSKRGKTFSRCIGDAIYQNISIGTMDYIDHSSPEYSIENNKAPVIKIGIWSMYSPLNSLYFTDRKHIGQIYPENLIGSRAESFMGFRNACEMMLEEGLSKLDLVTTQNQLISTIYKTQIIQYGCVLPHQLELCAPLLLCNRYSEALYILYGLYAQNWLNFHSMHDHLKECHQYEKYITLENEFTTQKKNITVFLNRVLGRKGKELREYFLECLNSNIHLANENRIIISPNFSPLLFNKE